MDYTGVSGGGRGRGCNSLNFPSLKALKSRVVSMISFILQPSLFIVHFSAFQLLEIYWKNEHRLMCTGEICTASERDCYEKPIYEAQRGMQFCVFRLAFGSPVVCWGDSERGRSREEKIQWLSQASCGHVKNIMYLPLLLSFFLWFMFMFTVLY